MDDHGSSRLAPRASWLLVKTYEALQRDQDALEVCETILERYRERAGEDGPGASSDEKLDYVAEASAERAVLLGKLGRYDEAIAAAKDYLAGFPAHTRWVEAQQGIIDFELYRAASITEKGTDHYDEAADLYYAWIASHPLDARAAGVSLRLGKLAEEAANEKAKQSDSEGSKSEGYFLARERYEQTAAKYPNTAEASEAQFLIGRLYENELFDYAKALQAYERVTGPWTTHARSRIAALREKSLILATKRIFRTDETASIELTTRNIEKLRVRVYALDFETFFRGTRGVGDVANLAIEVIAPDKSFDAATPDYRQYRETKRELTIETGHAGAWIVKVDDGDLEATTVVFVSDLALITKCAREELFVFAQNTRTQVAASGAKIVVTDGTRVVTEGTTDERGVWRYRGDATKGAALYVFATTEGGSGATTMDLSSLQSAQGLVARAAIWTDRPLYAPGDVIHAKAVLRDVEAGSYELPARVPHRFDAIDASGRLLASVTKEPDEFGTLRADFDVPESAAQGSYSLIVTRSTDQRVLANERVEVQRFTLPRVSLEIETEAITLTRGEKIEGVVQASWFFGGPVVGRHVVVRAEIDGGRVIEGETDADGRVRFSFDTESLASQAVVAVVATLAEENAVASETFHVRLQEFTVRVELPSKVFVTGDDMQARAVTLTHDGDPLAREVLFSLYEVEQTKKGAVERPRGEVRVTSESKDGVALAHFALAGDSDKRSGNWRLRVSSIDRNGATIEASETFFVSGADDATKLRVLSDIQHGSVGDVARLRVINRAVDRLALITIEGDGVLDFETRRLSVGETAIDVRFGQLHAPNFAWNVSLAGDERLYTARKDFVVSRPLKVDVRRVTGGRLTPGGEVPIEILATDGEGKPVEADFSIALVDQALLDVRGDSSPALEAIFWGSSVRRNTQLVTHGSTSFQYRAATRTVNSDLKAEERLLRRLEAEERAKDAWRERAGEMGDNFAGAILPSLREHVGSEIASEQEIITFNETIGIGGGAGGKFGGRAGGRRAQSWGNSIAAFEGVQFDVNTFGQTATSGLFYDDGLDGDIRARQEVYFARVEGNSALALNNDLVLGLVVANPVAESPTRTTQAGSALWIGTVRTDEAGRATTKLRLPRREGAFRLRARGVSKTSLFGEAKDAFEVSRDLLLEPVVPTLVLEGDVVHARLGVHWLGKEATRVSWKVSSQNASWIEGSKQIATGEEARTSFDIETKTVGVHPVVYEGTSTNGEGDRLTGGYEVRAKGIEERAARGGLLAGETSFELALPRGEYRGRSLTIEVGPEVPSELLPSTPISRRFRLSCGIDWTAPTQSNRASAGMTALALLGAWSKAAPDRRGAYEQLAATIRTTIGQIVAFAEAGNLAWIGKTHNNVVDPRAGLLGTLFLVRAQKAGFVVDRTVLEAMRARAAVESKSRDLERATLALLVMAEDGRGDFARFNALARSRNQMSLGAKARLVLAAKAFGRPGLASDFDLVTELRGRVATTSERGAKQVSEVSATQLQDTLWALLAVRVLPGNDALVRLGMDWLWSQRKPWGFRDPLATALAAELYTARSVDKDALAAKVTVRVGTFEKTIDLEKEPEHHRIDVPVEALKGGDVRVELATSGRGKIVYSALLEGTTVGLPEKRLGARGLVRRYLQPAPVLDGKALPEGFGIVDSTVKHWRNFATEVAIGDSIDAELEWRPTNEVRARFGSVVIEEPLPAGVHVRREEISGNFDDMEIGQGFLRFYLHGLRPLLRVRYTMRGVVAGEFGVLPPRVFSLDAKEQQAYGNPGTLRVLRDGDVSRDERRPTPDEMLARGVRLFDEFGVDDVDARNRAESVLTDLWSRYRDNLNDSAFGDVVQRLLRIALVKSDPAKTIALFEALRDRDPNAVLSFEDTEKVAAAYYASNEFERALQVREAICETVFLREVQIAGTLDGVGEIDASIQFMIGLFQNYPGLPSVRSALYALAQSLNERAAAIPDTAEGAATLRVALRRSARDLCREFLWRHPNDADADEVVFALASVALDAEQVQEAKALLDRAIKAHAESKWLDDFLYLSGYASFLEGDDKAALALLERVENEEFPIDGEKRGPSANRDAAIFLEGQIHHAAGRPAEAVAKYAAVEDRIIEAKQAADYFREMALELPEVEVLGPDEPMKLTLEHRNLEKVAITVYKVDLMRLYLMRKSLDDVGTVQLFGIAPVIERDFDLSGDPRYVEVKREFELPLEGRGAWLVIARTGTQTSTSLLVRSALEIEVLELAAQGRVRVNVTKDGLVVPKATVKVVGDRDGTIRSGRTDLRGVFVADDVQGVATVLVQLKDDYAFFRGEVALGAAMPLRGKAADKARNQQSGPQQEVFDALEGNRSLNLQIQRDARKQLEQLYKNTQRGVDLRRAK
ncbi:MAG: hypothetical protein KDC95_18705 [Planctomycetes bacterium]|nr:hypothetical protein [Planctomycetota bacterium]